MKSTFLPPKGAKPMPIRIKHRTATGPRRLRAWLERVTRGRPQMPAPQVLVRAPGFEFTFGDQSKPFHAASAGKLMTATLIAMLVEEGRFDFGTSLGALLPATDTAGLPAAAGVDLPTEVTVEHLLTHTSGLPDFFEPPRGTETACSIRTIGPNRDHLWGPSSLLDEVRRLPEIGRPGERFHYTDINYVLLGRIAEEATGERFAVLLRDRVLDPSGMTRSSTPYDADEPPKDPAEIDVAPIWISGHELSGTHSLSHAWACGGVVSVPEDLVRFQRALYGGRLLSPSHLARLTRPRHRFRRGIRYGAGTMTLCFEEFVPLMLRGLPRPVGHNGVTATHVFHYPQQDAHVVLNFHSTHEMNRSFMAHARIAQILAEAH